MPNTRLIELNWPLGLSAKDIKTSFACWGVYTMFPLLYCLIYSIVHTAPSASNVPIVLLWTLCDWGIWLLVIPVVFKYLDKFENLHQNRLKRQLQLIVFTLLFALFFRAGINVITASQGFAEVLLRFLPSYTTVLAVIIATWYLILRSNQNDAESTTKPTEKTHPETLLVDKGSTECLIRVDQIQYVIAARNYVEIYCNNQLYLTRTTMKQIESLLPSSLFLRLHRSHIINVNEIDRIKSLASDNAVVQLRCGILLSIGKKYKDRLKAFRVSACEAA